jgi:magnesium chelatase accessory protein
MTDCLSALEHPPPWWPNVEYSEFVPHDWGYWHIQRFGSGPIILMLHGTGASGHSFAELANLLKDRFELVIVDLPGQGFSSPLPERTRLLSAMASAAASLCDRLAIEPDYIVGHSAGAAVALRMAIDTHIQPRGILSINGALMPFAWFFEPIMLRAARLMSRSPRIAHFLAKRGRREIDVQRALRDTGSEISDLMMRCYGLLMADQQHIVGTLRMMGGWQLGQLSKDLNKVRVPVHLIGCSLDTIVPATRAHKATHDIPVATATTITGAGHLVQEERPGWVESEFSKFVVQVTD